MTGELRNQRRFLPSFNILRSFESAARYGSFTMAAEELNLTQSAISRQIKELESNLGVDLFRRVGRRVELTEAGATFADELSVDLERIRQTVFRAITAGEKSKSLRIATLPTFASRWLIPRLPDFEALHPDIHVNLLTCLEPFDFRRENYDAALHFGLANWPETDMQKLFAESMLPVASPAFRKRFNIDDAQSLLAAPLVHLETRPAAWNEWFELAGIRGLGAINGKQFGQFSMIISAATNSIGAALLPSYLIEEELQDGRLVSLSGIHLRTQNAYFIVKPEGSISPQLLAFSNWLQSIGPPQKMS
ncbi:LysR family transcriptional regulator [Parasphingopyxis algicola]|nr:LysR family transcriptional regulator [Parasphingopyxis algicola]